ncbi:MAG: retroviral-like aspartic protease family protein [Bacteroidales bacterium]|nr:retroviral-like aspartic protease family protein [Candidatus Colimorpha onthohippi]
MSEPKKRKVPFLQATSNVIDKRMLFVLCGVLVLLLSSCRFRPKRDQRHEDGDRYEERVRQPRNRGSHRNGKTTIPLEYADGVYYITVKVNDVPMRFVFDTGCSSISLSLTEVLFLYKQGTLTDDDIGDVAYIQDALGNITESQIITLRNVQVGDVMLHNVKATVVENQRAPLLFGQSALSQFGKISIDYNNNVLILE